jgi:hypothetical protein
VTDRPTAPELLEAVTEFLSGELLPLVDDPRLRFRTLVALNALGIAYRELVTEPPPELELEALARRIRAGDVREGDLPLLKEHVAAKLRVSNPGYLERPR